MGLADTYIKIRPDTSGFRPEADAELKKALADAGVTVKVKADTAPATRDLDRVDAKLAAVGRKHETATVDVDTSKAESKLEGLLGKLGGSGIGLGTASIATLGPAVAGLGVTALPVLGALAASFASAGAGAGAFAAVAMPAFKDVQTGSKSLATAQANLTKAQEQLNSATTKAQKNAADKAVQKALEEQNAALQKLSPAERDAVIQYNAFTKALTDFQRQLEPAVFPVIADGFGLIKSILPDIAPLVKSTADALNTLLTGAKDALGTPLWQSFFSFLSGSAHDSIVSFGRDAGNIATGLAGLLQAFAPIETGVQKTLEGITTDFANFGVKASVGADKGFNSFVDFTQTIAPQVKTDLGDIANLLGNTLTGLAPSVSPSLKLLDDIANGLGPVITPLEQHLPGVIDDVDSLVKKLSPLAGLLSSGFSSGAARTIGNVATGLGDLADEADKLPPGVIKAVGEGIGIIVTSAALSKLTGLSKLAGIISGIGSASAKAAPGLAAFDAAESGIGGGGTTVSTGGLSKAGTEAEKSEGKVGKLRSTLNGLGRDAGTLSKTLPFVPFFTQLTIDAQNATYKAVPALKTIDDSAQKQGSYWGIAKAGLKSYSDEIAKAFGGPTHETGNKFDNSGVNKLNQGLIKNDNSFFTIKAKDEATPVINKATQAVNDFAKLHPGVALSAKDQASGVTAQASKHLNLFTHLPSSVYLNAHDKTTGPTADAMRHLELFTHTPTGVTLNAKDNASKPINGAITNAQLFSALKPNITVGATDHASGPIGKIGNLLAGLHDKTINIRTYETTLIQTLRQSNGRATAHAAGGPVQPGEWSWVGEQGPELVRFGAAAHVYSHNQSAAIAANSGSGIDYDRLGSALAKAIGVRTAPIIGSAVFQDNTDVEATLRRAAFVAQATGLSS